MEKERIWALIGKIIVCVGTTIGIIVGFFQLYDRIHGPSLFAVGEISHYRLDPEIRNLFESRIRKSELLADINLSKKNNETPAKILNKIIQGDIPTKPLLRDIELDKYAAFSPIVLHFTIQNTGSEIAHDVKLMLPGEGTAEFEEKALVAPSVKSIKWSGEIPLGDLRPKAVLELSIWPKLMIAPNLAFINPAITHSKGNGKVFESHSFYGLAADTAYWFASRNTLSQAIFISAFILFGGSIVHGAYRRGYIVLKPDKSKPISSDH